MNTDENSTTENGRGAARGTARLDGHVYELHNLGNDLEEWCEVRVRRDLIPTGATLVECYLTEREIIVMGQPAADDESHDCDAMGCGTLSHVLHRLPLPNDQAHRSGDQQSKRKETK